MTQLLKQPDLMMFFFLLQALKVELIPYLLRLLDSGLEALDNPAATKAQIVKALKAMMNSLRFGEEVSGFYCIMC